MASIQVPVDGAGKRVDTVTLTDATVEVHRQKMVVTGGSGTAEVVVVTNANPAATDMGLVVRHAGTASVALAAGTNNIGTINNISATVTVTGGVAVSGTATVAGVVGLTAGTANIGSINNISATVTVAGNVNISATPSVVLAAGTANFGTLNNISATVTVAGNVNISTMPAITLAAGQTLNNISATTIVAGVVGLTAGTAVIGDLNAISRTVQVAVGTPFTIQGISTTVTTVISTFRTSAEVPSASRGPRCVTASTSANVTFVAAPGAGLAIYVTSLACSNAGAAGSRARVGSSATPGNVTMFMASAGGGFVMSFEPPWQLSANEALLCSVKPNTADGLFNCHFFVASADAF